MSLSASHNLNSSKHFRALGKLEPMSYKGSNLCLTKAQTYVSYKLRKLEPSANESLRQPQRQQQQTLQGTR